MNDLLLIYGFTAISVLLVCIMLVVDDPYRK